MNSTWCVYFSIVNHNFPEHSCFNWEKDGKPWIVGILYPISKQNKIHTWIMKWTSGNMCLRTWLTHTRISSKGRLVYLEFPGWSWCHSCHLDIPFPPDVVLRTPVRAVYWGIMFPYVFRILNDCGRFFSLNHQWLSSITQYPTDVRSFLERIIHFWGIRMAFSTRPKIPKMMIFNMI